MHLSFLQLDDWMFSIFCIGTLSLYTSLFRFILPIMTFRNTCYWCRVTCVCAGYYRVQKESSTAGKAVPSPDCITILVSTIVQLFWCKLHPYSMRTSSVFVYDYGLYSSQVTYWRLFLFFKKKEQKRNEKRLCLDIFFSISRHLEKCVLRGCSDLLLECLMLNACLVLFDLTFIPEKFVYF